MFEIKRTIIKHKQASNPKRLKDLKDCVKILNKHRKSKVIKNTLETIGKDINTERFYNKRENLEIEYEISYKKKKNSFCKREVHEVSDKGELLKSIPSKVEFTHKFILKPYSQKEIPLTTHLKNAKETFKTQIKKLRDEVKHVRTEDRNFTTADGAHHKYSLIMGGIGDTGGVHNTSGTIMRIKNYKEIAKCFEQKLPKSKYNHVGIEIEFYCNLAKEDLAAKMYEAKLQDYVYITRDGSIKNIPTGTFAHEVCVLAEEMSIKTIVERVCKVLSDAGAKVNKNCGLHVHLDARTRSKEVMFSNLVSAQNVLYGMNPKRRTEVNEDNGKYYCKRTPTKTFKPLADKYFGINPNSFAKLNTIEIRMHSGTVNTRKINNWVKLLTTIANKEDEIATAPRSIPSFVEKYNISRDVEKYIEERIELFNNGELNVDEAV